MKKSLFLGIIVGLLVFMAGGFQAHATDVGGIIDTDTTWTQAGSPYNITSTVQIDVGVTLTIEPGVEVNGNDNKIQLWGNLTAIGNTTSKIFINNVILDELPGSSETNVNIQFTEINAGWYYFCRYGGGSFTLLDSKIQNTWFINISECSNPSFMERNEFIEIGYVHIARSGGADIYIRNNVFYKQEQYALGVHGNNAIVELNSFLSTDRVAIELSDHATSNFNATNNYWNTTDTNIIDSMIYDRNNDLNIPYYIEYVPFLKEPHPNTPIPDFNQKPTAECGSDRIVFDTVSPDGRASFDPDGSIVNYYWKLTHKSDPTNYIEVNGVNPAISGLTKDFYDMCLTVTDDLGATNMKCCLLAAAGSCSTSPLLDTDEDGEPDITDLCSDTPADTMVDSDGCSLLQFCSAIDANSILGRNICRQSDWKNDEPLRTLGDCRPVRQGFSDFNCVPR